MKNLVDIANDNVVKAVDVVRKAADAFAQARFTYDAKVYDDAHAEYLRATDVLNAAMFARQNAYRTT